MFKSKIGRNILFVLKTLAVIVSTNGFAFANSEIYPNITRFFAVNSYGTLALNVGALDGQRVRVISAYQPLVIGEVFKLPKQRVFCFVIQHFGGVPIAASHKYTFKLYAKLSKESPKELLDVYPRPYKITDRSSKDMPSYCFTNRGQYRFYIETSSTDGTWFDGSYELDPN